jgi:hypothetical protein
MTALHRFAEQIIEKEMAVMTPEYKIIDKRKLTFRQVEVEERKDRKDLQPDIVGITDDGLRWAIEIRNSSEVKDFKKTKLVDSGITCLEIDVREQTLENLPSFLLESTENRKWINNPNYEALIAEMKRNKVSQVEKLLFDNQGSTLYIINPNESRKICIKEIMVLSKSSNGFYERIKVISEEGKPYVINIGSSDILKEYALPEGAVECDELSISTDKIPVNSNIPLNALVIEWDHSYYSVKERVEKLNEYKLDPQYDVKTITDCESKCKYLKHKGKCVYLKEEIFLNGVKHIICNRDKRLKDEDDISKVNPKYEDTSSNYSNPLPNCLPFDINWTLDDYYQRLESTHLYEIENGIETDIILFDKIGNVIILLYKDPDGVKEFCHFHIVIISIVNGCLVRNKLDYINRKEAENNYYIRLNAMRNNPDFQRPINNNIDSPF